MKIRIKQEPLYPSSKKPGVFFYENGLEDVWEVYTGIDDSELNRFKFSIGTWQELSKQNRGIQLIPIENLDFIRLGLSAESGEPKPSEPPLGFVDNTEENAAELEPIPPTDSRAAGFEFGDKNSEGDYDLFEPNAPGDTFIKEDDAEWENINTDRHFVSDGQGGSFTGASRAKREFEDGILSNFPWLTNSRSDNPRYRISDAKGYWIVGDADVQYPSVGAVTKKKLKRFFKKITFQDTSGTSVQYNDPYISFNWLPNLKNFTRFNKHDTYSPEFEWKWDGYKGEWIAGETIITEPQLRKPENIYFGFPIVSVDKPDSYDIIYREGANAGTYNFPVFYPTDSDEYNNTTAPAKVWFGINTFQVDTEIPLFKLKYHVLEWGDEDIKLTNEQILNSEFFSLYSANDDSFDRSQAKRLFQTIESSPFYLDEDGEMNLTEHTYTTPGVKTIKTILFRMSSDEQILHETILLNTNVVINDASEYKQDFDLFGAVEFNVLPLKDNTQELIIGGISEKSKYVKSIKTIERDDLYGSGDYLEKKYNENILPNIKKSLYGDSITKVDLSTTRLFTKPYDISYFLNSRATDILIDDSNCLIELNPDKNDGNMIENTGTSDQHAILIGDYEVVKEPNRDMRKKDNMDVPKIETRKKNQAF